jgi:hypothetical protein
VKKRIAASAIVVAAILATVGTAGAASTLKTVSQKAAEATPPPPSEVTATVAKHQLFDLVDLTCSAGYRAEEQITVSGKSPLVLTAAPLKEGAAVGDGTLLGEVNGSPVFAITGPFPLYRDLKLNDSGPDARMVNGALVRAGLLLPRTEPAVSTITGSTSAAVSALYARAGYPAPKAGDPVVTGSAFQVVPAPGKVSGKVHSKGLLGADPVAVIGIGTRGLICTSGGGKVPVEAKEGQRVRIPALGSGLHTVTIIHRTAAQTPAAGAPPAQDPAAAGSSSPAQAPAGTETTALFVEGDAKTSGVVTAALILSQSARDPLVVPSSALWTRNGQTLVTVQEASGNRDVPVVVAFSAAGENAVSAASPVSALAAGDKVVVAGDR